MIPVGLGTGRWIGVAGGLAVALGALTMLEVARPPEMLDRAVLDELIELRTPGLTSLATAVTDSGASPLTYPLIAVAGLLVGLRTRRWRPGVAALGVAVLGVLSRLLLSIVIGDTRPPVEQRLVSVHGFSFPSGHAVASALLAGTLIWLAGRARLRRPARLAIAAVLVPWAILVGMSRLYLGVHWISDVAGSWLLAGAWLCLLPLVDAGVPAGEQT